MSGKGHLITRGLTGGRGVGRILAVSLGEGKIHQCPSLSVRSSQEHTGAGGSKHPPEELVGPGGCGLSWPVPGQPSLSCPHPPVSRVPPQVQVTCTGLGHQEGSCSAPALRGGNAPLPICDQPLITGRPSQGPTDGWSPTSAYLQIILYPSPPFNPHLFSVP